MRESGENALGIKTGDNCIDGTVLLVRLGSVLGLAIVRSFPSSPFEMDGDRFDLASRLTINMLVDWLRSDASTVVGLRLSILSPQSLIDRLRGVNREYLIIQDRGPCIRCAVFFSCNISYREDSSVDFEFYGDRVYMSAGASDYVIAIAIAQLTPVEMCSLRRHVEQQKA